MSIEDSTPSLSMGNALSFDVLEQIFFFCAPGPFAFPPTRRDPHLVLTHVCSSWRSLAFETQLWRSLSITSAVRVAGWESASSFAKEWLSRLSDSKLSVSILEISCSPQFLYEIIMTHSSRFETIHIHLGLPNQAEELLSTPFDYLKTLTIATPIGVSLRLPDKMDAFPSLRHLELRLHSHVARLPTMSRFPLQSLLTLKIKASVSVSNFHELLLSCPSLETCAFSISREPTITDNRTICHTNLKKCILIVCYEERDPPEWLFKPLTLPNLESLQFSSIGPGQWSCRTLILPLQRSKCRIRKLWIQPHYGYQIDHMGALLSELPYITDFFLPRTGTIGDDEEILRKIGTGELLPRLQKLCVAMTLNEDLPDHLLDAVEKRAPGRLEVEGQQVSSIRELWCGSVRYYGYIDTYTVRLLGLQDRGVVIRTYDMGGPRGEMRILDGF